MKKLRKENWSSSSAIVKLQEALKSVRSNLETTRQALEFERKAARQREQERFEIEYRTIPLQEDLDRLRARLKAVEAENEMLKGSLKEADLERMAADATITLSSSDEGDATLATANRSPLHAISLSENKENLHVGTRRTLAETTKLCEELEREKVRREHSERLSEFLQLECKFQCCSCQVAAHDRLRKRPKSTDQSVAVEVATSCNVTDRSEKLQNAPSVETPVPTIATPLQATDPKDEAKVLPDVEGGVDGGNASELQSGTKHQPHHIDDKAGKTSAEAMDAQPSTPPRYRQGQQSASCLDRPEVRTVTTTTTVPMHFTPARKHMGVTDDEAKGVATYHVMDEHGCGPAGSGTFDRAAALAAIEYRRGRARSIANGHATPRKQMLEGVAGRRDISAPTLGQKSLPSRGSAAKAVGSAGKMQTGRKMFVSKER